MRSKGYLFCLLSANVDRRHCCVIRQILLAFQAEFSARIASASFVEVDGKSSSTGVPGGPSVEMETGRPSKLFARKGANQDRLPTV
jgi:hypothetical protein